MVTDATDYDLVERIRRGDAGAVEQAYDAYFTPVMNFIYYTVYDYETAADIGQEAFIKVVKAIKKKKDVRDFKSYLFTTARNMAFDELKRRKRRQPVRDRCHGKCRRASSAGQAPAGPS